MSKLVDGCIPAFTECPYKEECGTYGKEHCLQKGTSHMVSFSCAFARAFDITAERKEKRE